MKTDRELLELAAKAAECDYWPDGYDDELTEPCIIDGQFPKPWNPLTDDGDALRLAVRLRMEIDHNYPAGQVQWVSVRAAGHRSFAVEEFADESARISATRRAIVRAAAAIWEDME